MGFNQTNFADVLKRMGSVKAGTHTVDDNRNCTYENVSIKKPC